MGNQNSTTRSPPTDAQCQKHLRLGGFSGGTVVIGQNTEKRNDRTSPTKRKCVAREAEALRFKERS